MGQQFMRIGSLWFNEIANVLIIKLKLQHKFGKLFASSLHFVWCNVRLMRVSVCPEAFQHSLENLFTAIHTFCIWTFCWSSLFVEIKQTAVCNVLRMGEREKEEENENECQDFNHKCYSKIVINLVWVFLFHSSSKNFHLIVCHLINLSFSQLDFPFAWKSSLSLSLFLAQRQSHAAQSLVVRMNKCAQNNKTFLG